MKLWSKRWSKRLHDRFISSPRPSTSKVSLPREIVDIIIDIVQHSSPQSLFNCALVCRSWVPRARHNQFSDLIVSGPTLAEFVKLLDSPSSTLLDSITILTIGKAGGRWTPSRPIYRAISRLRRLDTLKLCYFDIVSKRMAGIGGLSQRCRRLHVEIHYGSFREGRQFVQMMCAFSQYKKITFSGCPKFSIQDIPRNCFSFPITGSWRLDYGL